MIIAATSSRFKRRLFLGIDGKGEWECAGGEAFDSGGAAQRNSPRAGCPPPVGTRLPVTHHKVKT